MLNTQFKKIRGKCFWNVCHAPQNNTAHPGILPTKPLFFTVEKEHWWIRVHLQNTNRNVPIWAKTKLQQSTRMDFYLSWRAFVWCRSSRAFITAWHICGMLCISQQRSCCSIRFLSSIRACLRSWGVCGGTGCPQTLLLSLSHTCLMGLSSGLTAGHSISSTSSSRNTTLVMRATWALALCAWIWIQANTVCSNQHML